MRTTSKTMQNGTFAHHWLLENQQANAPHGKQ